MTMLRLADVAVPVGVRRTFSYTVPRELQDQIAVGTRVVVPFGRKLLTGFVTRFVEERPEGEFRLRAIRSVLDREPIITGALVETALWVAEHYFTPPGEVLRALFPVGSSAVPSCRVALAARAAQLVAGGLKPPGLSPQDELLLEILWREGPLHLDRLASVSGLRSVPRRVASLSETGWVEVEEASCRPKTKARHQLGIRRLGDHAEVSVSLTSVQSKLYSMLEREGHALPLQDVLRKAGCTPSVAQALERKGLVEIAPLQIIRMPADLVESASAASYVLTRAQQTAFDALKEMLGRKTACRCLLHGVTGSGKTEIYLRMIAEALRRSETALLLVPEIGLTPMLSRIAVSHFPDQVALLHSGMSAGERFDQWNRVRTQGARVVVGTRSAVFAPLENLRLIIVDEEQDQSYKQDESPCYHARAVAWQRLQQTKGLLLLGSATPSMETYYQACESGESAYLSLAERIEARPLPEVEVVDMAVEFQRHGRKAVISQPLGARLQECLRRGEQSLLLLNRRGYARTLLCRSCGHVVVCSDCSVSMTYHQEGGRLICHYCGNEKEPPAACMNCGGQYIYYLGVGTEQLEEIVRRMFPGARLARMDRDTTRRKGALRRILLEFSEGKLDILVGTQMIAKGHDFPNVTLVGVIGADAGLSFPDFRSAERTFQLLTQVAGRAGRGTIPGRVVIQSFYPDHYALQHARRQDYGGFYRHEIEYRKLMGYPPVRELVQILVTDSDALKAHGCGEKIAAALKSACASFGSGARPRVLGPASAPLEKLRGKYRVQLLIKSNSGTDVLKLLHEAFSRLAEQRLPLKNVQVDVDPLSLL